MSKTPKRSERPVTRVDVFKLSDLFIVPLRSTMVFGISFNNLLGVENLVSDHNFGIVGAKKSLTVVFNDF